MVADRVGLKLWTVDEVDRLVSSGAVQDPEHYELLDGEIFEKMGQEEPHCL